ncbi:hypothetical protein SAMN05216464_111190 [Mucilaginibacter pineti]|uniref:Acetyltransferase n=1 Tax=Mucilaginibacter pineti TaxID=1391627 RepID=A0A1G7HEI0_9SPHI|nr:DUF6640 family protein [Mucilaginibacter pineti]SDE98761.1 hypothetical protein SAMN05216464_111190 [Mucilaginibacter pineti]
MKKQKISIGLVLITLVALWSTGGSYIFDWNHTHIYNPHWPPHAKFHNAQTMLLGSFLGCFALWMLWVAKLKEIDKLRFAVVLASFYWLTQVGASLFPGTALSDPEFSYPGEPPHQLIVDVVMLLLLAIAWPLEIRRIKKMESDDSKL